MTKIDRRKSVNDDDFKVMLAEMCLAWIRATDYANHLGWSEKRTVQAPYTEAA
jgi:hypothetical protein